MVTYNIDLLNFNNLGASFFHLDRNGRLPPLRDSLYLFSSKKGTKVTVLNVATAILAPCPSNNAYLLIRQAVRRLSVNPHLRAVSG